MEIIHKTAITEVKLIRSKLNMEIYLYVTIGKYVTTQRIRDTEQGFSDLNTKTWKFFATT